MRRGGAIVLACALLTTAAHAQSFQQILNHCTDRARPPDRRIEACQQLYNAQGLEPAEYALAALNLGAAYEAEKDNARAIAAYSEAIKREPNLWQAYADRIMLRLGPNDLDAALDDYARLVRIDPSKVRMDYPDLGYGTEHDASRTRGGVHETGEYDRAVAQAREALANALTRRCAQRHLGNDAVEPFADCDRALVLAPRSYRALGLRGMLELQHGQDSKAIADFNASLAAQPDFAPSLYARGLARRRIGDHAGGDADIKAALVLQPDVDKMFALVPDQGK
jgi:tetratricopeptide (TPR) repeat protein